MFNVNVDVRSCIMCPFVKTLMSFGQQKIKCQHGYIKDQVSQADIKFGIHPDCKLNNKKRCDECVSYNGPYDGCDNECCVGQRLHVKIDPQLMRRVKVDDRGTF